MLMETLTTNISGKTRYEMLEGRQMLVVPMIMITEGVHNGSSGRIYYPSGELKKTPQVWDHKPVVVYHPTLNGKGISACSPSVLNTQKVGIILNTKFKKGKLHAEAWLDPDRLEVVDKRVLAAIEADEMQELSTGLFTDNESGEGEWNGEEYDYVARNYRPDHLAILPDQIGACSKKDGAGFLRLNSQNVSNLLQFTTNNLTTNEKSFGQITEDLAQLLKKKGGENSFCWPCEVYEDFFVYGDNGKYYSQEYEISKSGEVSLSVDGPTEVFRVTEYRDANGKTVMNSAQTGEENVERKTIIDGLITNKRFAESDRAALDAMTDDLLAKVASTDVTPPAGSPAPVANTVAPAAMTPDQIVAQLPPEYRMVINESIQIRNAERTTLISDITTNAAGMWTPEQLATMDTAALKNLATLAKRPAASPVQNMGGPLFNFAGMGAGAPVSPTNNSTAEEPLTMLEF